jgi:hypothetical protein
LCQDALNNVLGNYFTSLLYITSTDYKDINNRYNIVNETQPFLLDFLMLTNIHHFGILYVLDLAIGRWTCKERKNPKSCEMALAVDLYSGVAKR